MKQKLQFCLNSIIFIITIIFLSYIINYTFIDKWKASIPGFVGSEIYKTIQKSKKKVKIKKLLIGDSTANQFFPHDGDDIIYYSLACNQAIGVCGQYFLLNNFLSAGNRPEEVYMLYTPEAFNNNLDQIYTFHYFLKPFYRKEYKQLMSENVIRQIHKIPFYRYSQLPFVIGSAWAPDYQPPKDDDIFLSLISAEYLKKIVSLQEYYGFNLYIVPTFVAENKKNIINKYKLDGIKDKKTLEYMEIYKRNIVYLPNDCFVDNIHLSNPNEYKMNIIASMNRIKREVDDLSKL